MLSCYEHAITVGEEVRCVWRRRVSGGSVLFVLNRYAVLASSLASIIHVLPQATIHGALGGFTTGNPALTLNKVSTTPMRLITTILTKVSQAYVPTSRSLLYVLNPCFQLHDFCSLFRCMSHLDQHRLHK